MDYSADSIRYLHIAYTIMIGAQLGYAGWLAVRWNRTKSAIQSIRKSR